MDNRLWIANVDCNANCFLSVQKNKIILPFSVNNYCLICFANCLCNLEWYYSNSICLSNIVHVSCLQIIYIISKFNFSRNITKYYTMYYTTPLPYLWSYLLSCYLGILCWEGKFDHICSVNIKKKTDKFG